MNGRPLGVQFKRNSAYVAQEDCFVPTMSAMETLNFTATLTLPKSVTAQERADRIEEVLRIMGLYRSRDTQASILSHWHVFLVDLGMFAWMLMCSVHHGTVQLPQHSGKHSQHLRVTHGLSVCIHHEELTVCFQQKLLAGYFYQNPSAWHPHSCMTEAKV